MTVSLKDFIAGRPPLQRGSMLVFVGLGMVIAGIIALKVTTQNYWWALLLGGIAVSARGGIAVSRIPGE
jgi:hypothetical protein